MQRQQSAVLVADAKNFLFSSMYRMCQTKHNKEVLRNKFAGFRTERRWYTGVLFLNMQIYFFTISGSRSVKKERRKSAG
jgi:hypothetical protein